MTNEPDDARIGELIGTEEARRRWRELVLALHEASRPGNPLDGWVFHGTAADTLASMAEDGVMTTEAMVGTDDASYWVAATHWGSPKVAAFYAEDRIESREDPDLELAIVAARISDLEDCGPLEADGQSVDCPIFTRLGHPEAAARAIWEASTKDWHACNRAFGSFLVVGPVGPDCLEFLRTPEDLGELLASLEAGPVPA